MPVNKYN